MKLHDVVVALLASSALAGVATAAESTDRFEVTPRLGVTTLSLDAQALKSNQPIEEDAGQLGVNLRYVNHFGPMVEVGHNAQRTRNWDDHDNALRLTQYELAVGWQFETAKGFRITPKVGRARWDLYSPDALLTQTKAGTNTRRGYDTFWELSLEKTVTDSIALGVAFRDNGYEFGNVRSVAFIASFAL